MWLTNELKLEFCQYLKFSLRYIIYTIFEAIFMFYLKFVILFIYLFFKKKMFAGIVTKVLTRL